MTVNCIAAGGQGSGEYQGRGERERVRAEMRENGPCVIASFAQLASVRGLASPSPASGPRARVGASVFGSAPSPALSFICGSRHAHHLWRGATYGAHIRIVVRHDHSRSRGLPRALSPRLPCIRTVPRFARGRPPRPLSPPTGTRSSLSCRVVLDAQGGCVS